ncbi:hypothetical protein RND81_14G154700 [Saponaria officinalis]|uniref:Uncharacterized protein n=1 Tax=Saponaria officinalis TaxID=3572 RepID=A0AAW1GUB9_SAPOF
MPPQTKHVIGDHSHSTLISTFSLFSSKKVTISDTGLPNGTSIITRAKLSLILSDVTPSHRTKSPNSPEILGIHSPQNFKGRFINLIQTGTTLTASLVRGTVADHCLTIKGFLSNIKCPC